MLLLAFVLVPQMAYAQIVNCPHRQEDCPGKAEILAIKGFPEAGWVIIPVEGSTWSAVAKEHNADWKIPAFTDLLTHRTYVNIPEIWKRSAKSGLPGLRIYLAHELGHILTNSRDEKFAEAKAQEILKHLS